MIILQKSCNIITGTDRKEVDNMSENDIQEIFGKSIWDMTTEEIIKNNLTDVWVKLVDKVE